MSTLPPVNNSHGDRERTREAPTPLARRIAREIAAGGPITFREFMERALYEPGSGYYARAHTPWAEEADFVTAPQVDAAYGGAVARLAQECDAALGAPQRFDLVEMGGGDGALLSDACDELARIAPDLYARLRVSSIERGAAAREQQQRRLAQHAQRLRWLDGLEELPEGSLSGLLFSNELLDALPVHRVAWRGGRLRELLVDAHGSTLRDHEADPSTPELAAYLRRNNIALAEGQVAEICLAVRPWMETLARRLARGFVLTVDYGAETAALYDGGSGSGTLVCQHRYQLNAEPYERVGEQDITAHVDLGNLRRCGEDNGIACAGVAGLAVFLMGFGATVEPAGERDDADAVRRRLGLRHLLFTEIGDAHRAMLQYKNVEPIPFGLERLG